MSRAGTLRNYHEVERGMASGPQVRVNGKSCLTFCCQDYLGLSRHPAMLEAMREAVDRYGCGMAGSRFIGGTSPLHHQAERALAALHDGEAAVLYANGYMANLGSIAALAKPGDVIFSDELNHASIIDGCRLSRSEIVVWRHNDVEDLRLRLQQYPSAGNRFVICESLYSMEGHFAPVREVLSACAEFGCFAYVDEIHAVDVYDPKGDGYAAQLGLSSQVDLLMAGAGKALGSLGGYVVTRSDPAALLKSRSRAFIFTTALPPAIVSTVITATELVVDAGLLRRRILENARTLRSWLREADFDCMTSESHIVPILTGSSETTGRVTQHLLADGLYAQGVTYPSVPRDRGRLRIAVTADHTLDDLDRLVSGLKKVRNQVASFPRHRSTE